MAFLSPYFYFTFGFLRTSLYLCARMMKVGFKIWAISMALVFMAANTGLSYISHHCRVSGSTHSFLNQGFIDCTHEENTVECTCQSPVDEIIIVPEKCCIDILHYDKVQVETSLFQKVQVIPFCALIATLFDIPILNAFTSAKSIFSNFQLLPEGIPIFTKCCQFRI